jgi:GLPGLI family protein
MKKLLLIILIFKAFSHSFYAQQSAKVVYEVIQSEPENNLIRQKNFKRVNKFFALAKEFQFILEFNPNESIYYIVEPLVPDDIDKSTYTLAKLLGGVDSVYQDKKVKLSYLRIVDDNNNVYLEYQNLYQNWMIGSETDSLLGFKVIKAQKGKAIVWFAPEIPVPFGPNNTGGLPGLILKFKMGDRIIQAKSIKFYNKLIAIKKPVGKEISFELMKKRRMEEMAKFMSHNRR